MLRQLILICAIGGLPLMSAAAGTAATSDVRPVDGVAQESSKALECTQAQAGAATNQQQGPVWVVQIPAPASPQGPVWVVQQERPVKPMS
jgi:hypothetical protein